MSMLQDVSNGTLGQPTRAPAAYPATATMTHCDEKDVDECRVCACLPMAHREVSRSWFGTWCSASIE